MESLVFLALIWTAVFIANIAARVTRLSNVLWFLALGSIMVNVGLLPSETDPFIAGLAELAIILIMFALGFEEETGNFVASIKKSWGIAFFGGLAPFCAAYFVADYFWNDVNISIMCGLTMTATAVSLSLISLKTEGLHRSPAATRIMTSAVLDDIASLALVAILVPIAAGNGDVNAMDILLIVGKSIAFFVVVSVAGAWIFPHEFHGWMKRVPFLGYYGFRHVLAFGEHSTLTVLLLAVLVGILAHAFGFHPAIGAYMAGLILKKEYFEVKDASGSFEDTRRIVENVAFSWVGPVFFITLGTRLVFDQGIFLAVVPQILTMVGALFVAQVVSAATAARYTSGMDWPGGLMIGFGMLGRAELAFVVMDIAYVQNAILSTEAFYTLMATAFILNVMVPITIRLWKPVYARSMQNQADN